MGFRWPVRVLGATTVAIAIACVSGCASFLGASPERTTTAPQLTPLSWPGRFLEPLQKIASEPLPEFASPFDVYFLHSQIGKLPGVIAKRREERDRAIARLAETGDLSRGVPVLVPSEHRGVFGQGVVSVPLDESEGETLDEGEDRGTSIPIGEFTWITNRHEPHDLDQLFERHRADGTMDTVFNPCFFRLYAPANGTTRGLIVALSSRGGQEQETPLREKLLQRGWAVLVSSPPVQSMAPFEISIDSEDEIEPVAAAIGNELDQRVADAAYATEGALEFLAQAYPEIPQSSVHILAYSLGATVAPTVAARLGDRVRSIVLVGGGAHFAQIALDGYTKQPLKVHWGEALDAPGKTSSAKVQLLAAVLAQSKLDPYWTAPHSQRTPVLMLRARSDRIVPEPQGELLYERLGRPDCYSFPFGHVWLFWRLPSYADVISDWIDVAAQPRNPAVLPPARMSSGSSP